MRKQIPSLVSAHLIQVIDEIPLWSAPFGLALLEEMKYRPGMNFLDVGCGTGFPLLEIAQRLGDSCRVYGIDPWTAVVERARAKASIMQVTNVEIVVGKAEQLPFPDRFFDVVVSNNGINNVEDAGQALAECHRVCKPGGQMLLTVNLPGTMQEFYDVFEATLRQVGKTDVLPKLRGHIFAKRKPLAVTKEMLSEAGFRIQHVKEDSFTMRFLDGTSLLNHFFIQLAFVEPWESILHRDDTRHIFDVLEANLNVVATSRGELKLTIPFACIDSCKE